MAQITQLICRESEHQIEWATTGEQAVERFTQALEAGEPYSLLLFDLVIPGGMGGLDTLRAIRQVNADVPAIACSGYSDESPVAPEAFHALLPKPFTRDQLRAAIALVSEGVESS